MNQNDRQETEIEQKRTYQCDHCGSETFGLVVEDGEAVAARCHLCNEVVVFD